MTVNQLEKTYNIRDDQLNQFFVDKVYEQSKIKISILKLSFNFVVLIVDNTFCWFKKFLFLSYPYYFI